MGQYYAPTTFERDNKVTTYDLTINGDFNGSKLMEHSYMINDFMTRMTRILLNSPRYVMWVGDYADDEVFQKNIFDKFNITHAKIMNAPQKKIDSVEPFTMEEYLKAYLINHTQKIYISFNEYIVQQGCCSTFLHPLPLLTAIGNGMGGGDYCGSYMEFIGTWAGNLIEVSFEEPKEKDYKKCNAPFFEEEAQDLTKQELSEKVKGDLIIFIANKNKWKRFTQQDCKKIGLNPEFLWLVCRLSYCGTYPYSDGRTSHTREIYIPKKNKYVTIAYGIGTNEKKINEENKKTLLNNYIWNVIGIDWVEVRKFKKYRDKIINGKDAIFKKAIKYGFSQEDAQSIADSIISYAKRWER